MAPSDRPGKWAPRQRTLADTATRNGVALRVLMSTWGWRSHLYCLVPVGWALQAAGHEVRVASHPSMAQAISSAGLAAVPLGEDLDFATEFAPRMGKVGQLDQGGQREAAPDGTQESSITADGGVARFAAALVGDLVEFGRTYRPDLLIWEPFNLAAPVAAAALGVPGVLQLWGPDSSVTLRLDKETVIGPLAARFGLGAAEVSLTGTLMLDPVPPPMQVPLSGPSEPVRFVPYNGTAVVPGWLRRSARRPRVCVTAGTMMAGAGFAGRMDLTGIIWAVAELDVEVVVAVDPAQQAGLGALPDNVRVADAPLALRLVLPSCAAIVQQGGAGTTMTALAYGVPQLILPQVSDQHFNGERLAATGAGAWLAMEQASPGQIRDMVGELVGGGRWSERAALMSERVHQMPAPAAVVPVLTTLAPAPRLAQDVIRAQDKR
jgi:UDP:flavonoid glycosyltransferase YjiC (YdhE family)